ncbi:MAG TPA: hypothetical protein VGM91_23420 [Conexibacter sp.]
MNLIVPVNVQALRVTPNDASLITKDSDLFAGPTTSFDELPWRDSGYIEHAGRVSKANVSANVINPFSGGVVEQLEAGVHLHWSLPDGLTRGAQQPDGTLTFPTIPNRWLVTRLLQSNGQTQAKQWVVESDRLMTGDEYANTYYPATRRKAVSIPVGWSLVDGSDPRTDGQALYYPPSRRMGVVFELASWQPVATATGTPRDQVLHLDELARQATAFAQDSPPQGLKAVGANGPSFAAYYPDSRSVLGFHDTVDEVDLGRAAFEVSYVVVGWHSHASDDPLRATRFTAALAGATTANAAAAEADRLDAPQLAAATALETYGWHYDPALGTPDRTLYSAQLAGLQWDTTGALPASVPTFPKCYLTPLADDPTLRLAVGSSASSALAALIRHEWSEWVGSAWSSGDQPTPDVDDRIEADLELLLDALQLGLLQRLGSSSSLPQLEQTLHQTGFGSLQGGQLWTIRARETEPDKADPGRFGPADAPLPTDDNDVGDKLATLNECQTRMDALLVTIDTARRQIFTDWYHYIAGVGEAGTDAQTESLKAYISGEVLDLYAKLAAAFGTQAAAGPAGANLPVFFSDPSTYLTVENGRYVSPSPPTTLAGQIASAANAILDVLAQEAYAGFELERAEGARFWQPNEPIVVVTGDSLKPAQRNGTAKYLPCRVSGQPLATLQATSAATQASVAAADAAAALSLVVPQLNANSTPEAVDTLPLLDDVTALLGEACLLDATLAPVLAGKLSGVADGTLASDLQAALQDVSGAIARAWQAGVPDPPAASMPAIVSDPGATAGALQITLHGQAPQGVGLTARDGDAWEDPFLALLLVWEVSYEPFAKGTKPDAATYDQAFVKQQYRLDEDTIELVLAGAPPATQGGAATLSGFIPLSSRASDPLLAQIQGYLENDPDANPQLQAVIDHLRGKPLLSQGLSGVNQALLSHSQTMELVVFNPFYDAEPPATALSADTDTVDYANVLTHFVAWASAGRADQAPLGAAGFNPLRSGYLSVARVEVVDVFGRRRPVIQSDVAADAAKVVVSEQLQPPPQAQAQIGLPPRLAQPARLHFEWVSGNDARLVTNDAPSTSPVTGWVVSNYLDNSLMLFAPSGSPLGSLGVFGAQSTVAWQSAPGNPARPMEVDLGGADLDHFRKFATFILGRSRAFFDALTAAIENAHTYILADGDRGQQPYAVLMGRPLALVRAELRLELAGLPAFNTSLDAVSAGMPAGGTGPYDWTRRDDAGLRGVDFPVRLGDRHQLSDGLVAYLLDGPDPYDTLYAPGATQTGGTGVRQPAPDTLLLKPRAALDPPSAPYADAAAQIAALQDATQRTVGAAVTLLIDPRASVHATTGILPSKEITLPAESYARALQSIEVAFFTHPVLRGAQGLELPVPDEAGFAWRWALGSKATGVAQPVEEDLPLPLTGDRAQFNFSPQVAQDGWLKLVPHPGAAE